METNTSDSPALPIADTVDAFASWPLVSMTEEEVFETAARHLLTQNEKSRAEFHDCAPPDQQSPACLYRGPRDLKCAAGPFIPDEFYKPEMEGEVWAGNDKSLLSRGLVPDKHANLIRQLQIIHDANRPSQWRSELADLADENGFEEIWEKVRSEIKANR